MDEIWAHDQDKFRDPARRWLRHTFQEGPGFRFLATRGGRPPLRREPRGVLAIARRRAQLLRVAREQGLDAALSLKVCSRTTLWRWIRAHERGGLQALLPQPRGPRAPRATHPGWVEQVVIAVRLQTYWNAKRISAELRRRGIAEVGHTWIEELFDSCGTSRPSGPRARGPRYERTSVNSLWHIDIKGPFFIQLERHRYLKTWIYGLVDDHSRYVLGLHVATGREVFRSLADAEVALERFARYYNYHRLHGEIGWCTPGERYDGTPFTDEGFENVPALAHMKEWLDELKRAA